MQALEPGSQQLLQARLREVPAELRVSVSEIRIGGESERLYSIENLSGELTAREASAWRNLIRVLTHEIMNSITPVTSLATTAVDVVKDMRDKVDKQSPLAEDLADVRDPARGKYLVLLVEAELGKRDSSVDTLAVRARLQVGEAPFPEQTCTRPRRVLRDDCFD